MPAVTHHGKCAVSDRQVSLLLPPIESWSALMGTMLPVHNNVTETSKTTPAS